MASNGERGGPSEWLLTWIWDYPNFFFNSRSPVRRFSPFELNRISCSMRNIRLLLHPGFSSGRSLVRNVGGIQWPVVSDLHVLDGQVGWPELDLILVSNAETADPARGGTGGNDSAGET